MRLPDRRDVWLVMLFILVSLVVAAPVLAPYQPGLAQPGKNLLPPNSDNPLGTDHLGRDIYSRVLWGGRTTLYAAAIAVAVSVAAGLTTGAVSGAFGGKVDWIIMRGVDVLLAFPGLLLALALVVVIGTGVTQSAVAVGLSLAPTFSRLVRASVVSVRHSDYIEAAYAMGGSRFWVLRKHILSGISGHVLAYIGLNFAWSLTNLAAFDFLGISGSPSIISWGRMLGEGRAYIAQAPWISLVPGVLLTLTVIAVMAVSDAIRDDWDTRIGGF